MAKSGRIESAVAGPCARACAAPYGDRLAALARRSFYANCNLLHDHVGGLPFIFKPVGKNHEKISKLRFRWNLVVDVRLCHAIFILCFLLSILEDVPHDLLLLFFPPHIFVCIC